MLVPRLRKKGRCRMNINDAARDDEIKLAATRIDDAMRHIKTSCSYCSKMNDAERNDKNKYKAAKIDEIDLVSENIDDAMIHIKNICGYCGKCNLTKATCVVCKSYKKLDTAKRDLVELVRELEGIDWKV